MLVSLSRTLISRGQTTFTPPSKSFAQSSKTLYSWNITPPHASEPENDINYRNFTWALWVKISSPLIFFLNSENYRDSSVWRFFFLCYGTVFSHDSHIWIFKRESTSPFTHLSLPLKEIQDEIWKESKRSKDKTFLNLFRSRRCRRLSTRWNSPPSARCMTHWIHATATLTQNQIEKAWDVEMI